MKIISLIDNKSSNVKLESEHCLSIYIETETEKEILFIAAELKRLTSDATYYTGHCTGNEALIHCQLSLKMICRNL